MAETGTETRGAPSPLFLAPLSAEGQALLARHISRQKLQPGEVLIARDDTDDDVFQILAGTVRVIIYAPNGRAVLLRDLGAGETFGELAALDGQPRSASVEARSEAQVARVPGHVFRALVEREPALALALLRRSIGYVRHLSERIYELGSFAVANRVHVELLRLARESGVRGNTASIDPIPRHADLADRVCTSREAVTRELGRLAKLGLVEQVGRTLHIRDLARIERMIETGEGL